MIVKYKVSDFAKDLSISAKKVLDELNAMGSTGKKNSSTLEENELNYLLEKFSKDNSVKSLDEFLNSAKAPKAEPKPAEKKAEPKAEKKPEAPKAPKAEPAMAEAKPAAKQNNKKNEQHKKREEKTVSLSELARETGAKATAASAQSVSVRREDNQVTVDTRTVDMNVDRFDARYDDLASTKNTENRRKGNILYDKETKNTELVKWEESIEDYMAREVLPHIPDAAAFFEENLGAKKPVIKTGAEIPFTRYFYKYQPSTPSEELETRFKKLELSVTERVAKLFE